jgi:RNA recognition motif-containing protein
VLCCVELKRALYSLFSQFGSILEINVSKAFRLRGQAWIVFKAIPSATTALRELQNFPFFDKPMHIQFAKDTSDPISKIEGKPIDTEARRVTKRKRDEEFRMFFYRYLFCFFSRLHTLATIMMSSTISIGSAV